MIGKEQEYNYNGGEYSPTGYPFESYQLKLQASYSTSVYDPDNLQSMVFVSVTLANIGIDWGYHSGRDVKVYWNGTQVASFAPPNLLTTIGVASVSTLGTASFPVQHESDGSCTGEMKIEWDSEVLAYTVGGVTKNITELGCKAIVTPDPIEGGTVPSDVLMINGKSFLPVIKMDGIETLRADVNRKSIITMNGTEWATEKKRHTMKVSLLDMSAEQFAEYAGYLSTNPASVIYKDDEDGIVHSGTFYIYNIKHTKRMTIPGVIYLTNISFELSERTAT